MPNRRILEQSLAEIEMRIQQDGDEIREQRAIIAEMEQDHQDCTSSKVLLELLGELRTLHEEIRHRLWLQLKSTLH